MTELLYVHVARLTQRQGGRAGGAGDGNGSADCDVPNHCPTQEHAPCPARSRCIQRPCVSPSATNRRAFTTTRVTRCPSHHSVPAVPESVTAVMRNAALPPVQRLEPRWRSSSAYTPYTPVVPRGTFFAEQRDPGAYACTAHPGLRRRARASRRGRWDVRGYSRRGLDGRARAILARVRVLVRGRSAHIPRPNRVAAYGVVDHLHNVRPWRLHALDRRSQHRRAAGRYPSRSARVPRERPPIVRSAHGVRQRTSGRAMAGVASRRDHP